MDTCLSVPQSAILPITALPVVVELLCGGLHGTLCFLCQDTRFLSGLSSDGASGHPRDLCVCDLTLSDPCLDPSSTPRPALPSLLCSPPALLLLSSARICQSPSVPFVHWV